MARSPALAAVALLSCSHASPSSSVLQASDLVGDGAAFQASEIVASAPLVDGATLTAAKLLAFLGKTPYGTASFLASYSSHGTPASQALVASATRYHINPIALLVRAEMDGGLVGATGYPSPSGRVEFVFGCGCRAPGDCDAAYSGLDVQLDCLAASLRESLDAVAAHGKTDGGWGPGAASTTLDGVRVKPSDDSTAAIYQYAPLVAVGQGGGSWLFWNLWRRYAGALGYTGPAASAASWIGAACAGSSACVYGGTPGVCAGQFPGGLCTLPCTTACPSATGQAQTFCADFGAQGGFCLPVCNPADPQCRSGYTCQSVKQFGDTTTSAEVCFP